MTFMTFGQIRCEDFCPLVFFDFGSQFRFSKDAYIIKCDVKATMPTIRERRP
jgi:hypothetical protein